MRFYAYHIVPIDFGWHLLSTVEETAARLGADEARSRVSGDIVEEPTVAAFADLYKRAQTAAMHAGWEGDFRQGPVVFWIPEQDGFYPGFVWKQDNNGSTFVVSPVRLPHLEKIGTCEVVDL
ncbi:hypothetical protein K7G19_20960 [Cupriavidus sp. DB3]|uniref:hypothetical protein n=1 Tax=Cupriavidus sp. DB3 TaxID=2873259 RepID=UPI001CF44851|nr:hypothetical protein [Cupriavidus sp. DB3]MCA7086064.1 hypothetical protein [Cupriavidus sp. DB3]